MDRMIIDGRLLQTSAWYRGMGRYLTAMIGGIVKVSPGISIDLILTDAMDFEDSKRKTLDSITSNINYVHLNLLNDPSDHTGKKNKALLDDFVHNEGLVGSLYISSSLFSFDYQPIFPSHTYNTVIFYDMIPLKHWEVFNNYYPEHEYFKRFKYLYEVDKIFSISESVKQDLINYLGFKPEDIQNIDGAEIPDFITDQLSTEKSDQYKFKYVLLPGGDSPHKNMLRGVRGFDIFNAEFGDLYKLVITSHYSQESMDKMKFVSKNIVFSGQVDDAELHHLFKNAELILFPSLDEGLGLPVLEAVGYDKKVACSNIPIFKEISNDAFSFFDPSSVEDIARAIKDGLLSDKVVTDERYTVVKNKFTWENTARKVLDLSLEKPAKDRAVTATNIIVEQDGSLDTLQKISQVFYDNRHANIDLFIDTEFERYRDKALLPVLHSHFVDTHDVVDVVNKLIGKESHTIVTKRSSLTQYLKGDNAHFYFVGTTAKKAIASTIKLYATESSDELKAVLVKELKSYE